MPTYYVGQGGNDGNTGLSWAQRKLTLNGAEDIPVAAGDIVYVGAGVYRETLTVDVSGAAGSPITYIGDYTGANTDGVGGVVRITGSNNDTTIARNSCITSAGRNYRSFRGFLFDMPNLYCIYGVGSYWVVEQCLFQHGSWTTAGINVDGAYNNWIIRNCAFMSYRPGYGVYFNNGVPVDNTNMVIENCLFAGSGRGIVINRYGGITIRNCDFMNVASTAIWIWNSPTAGQVTTVNNCTFSSVGTGLDANNIGEIVEDYNAFFDVGTPRVLTNIGVNSNTYPPLFDSRWFFEAVNGGRMVTPFDLGQWSQLINLAGTSPTATDLRGTGAIGGVREWGPLEYDTTLLTEGGGGAVSISPFRGNIG